jgi:sperm-associated antigen 1
LQNSNPENIQTFDSIKPAIRSTQQPIDLCKPKEDNKKVCSTHDNYAKWDKYDPDTEILRMDLQEEKNHEKPKVEGARIQEITENDVCRLSVVEKKELAKQHKYKGNDLFRVGDYEAALQEYSASLKLDDTSTCLNNRALVYFKLSQFGKAIRDCDRSLVLEPKNSKALFRKAESLLGLNRKSTDAFDIYQQILKDEPHNKLVSQKMEELRKEMPDLQSKQPPAYRMK